MSGKKGVTAPVDTKAAKIESLKEAAKQELGVETFQKVTIYIIFSIYKLYNRYTI